jgi:hypothetical protein
VEHALKDDKVFVDESITSETYRGGRATPRVPSLWSFGVVDPPIWGGSALM